MAKVSKDMLIGQLLQIDAISHRFYESRNALPWMPIFPDGISRRSSYGSWTGC